VVSCDLCGSSEFAVLFTWQDPCVPDRERTSRVVECHGCGLIYLYPRPGGSEIAAYYQQDCIDDLGRAGGPTRRRSSSLRKLRKSIRRALLEEFYCYPTSACGPRAWANGHGRLGLLKTACLRVEQWRLRLIGREAAIIPFTGEGRLLDVGCGTGKALEAFRKIGWDITGVEINPQAASIARRRLGCQILLGGFEEVPLDNERFDVVRFCHSLEHLPSPRGALEKAHRILRPTGLVWIEVPNAASLERHLFGEHWFGWGLPGHLYHFTQETLAHLLARTGFRPLKLKHDGRALVFAESVSNVLECWLGNRPRRTKWIKAMARPLTCALGAMNRGSILFVHAEKNGAGRAVSSCEGDDRRSWGSGG